MGWKLIYYRSRHRPSIQATTYTGDSSTYYFKTH